MEKTRVKIYFQREKIDQLKREAKYTITDFLAIYGGLLGLCFGYISVEHN